MTDARALPRDSWRDYAWVAIVLLVFVPVQVAALFVANWFTRTIGVGNPEREHVAFAAFLLGGLLMIIVVPFTGRLLGLGVELWARWLHALPVMLAAVAGYVFFEDVRSGFYFETDHALPEIFIPYAVVLLASAAIGHRLAGDGLARTPWMWVVRIASGVTVALIGLTALKMAAWGGDFALDSPVTVLVLVVVGVYAVVAVATAR